MSSNFSNSIQIGVVDLSTSEISIESHSFQDDLFKKYLGGEGLAADYLLRKMPSKADPLGPDNILCFITGVLSGTTVPFSGRYIVAGKSPLTGTWGEANSGGRFGPELRQAGFDLLLIKGKAKELSILNITNDSIEIIPSSHLKGLDCVEIDAELKKKYGSKVQIASIGLAGENLVLITGIVTDKSRVAGRSGLGCDCAVIPVHESVDAADSQRAREGVVSGVGGCRFPHWFVEGDCERTRSTRPGGGG